MTQEQLGDIKEKVARADNLLEDMRQVDELIDFLGNYSGDEDNGIQLRMEATYYPDDCMNGSGVEPEQETYEDKSLTLGTFCSKEIIKALKTCREEMNKMFKELQV